MIALTQEQADAIRALYESNPGWGDVELYFPKAAASLASLPDESMIIECNVMFREMYADAREFVVSGTGPLGDADSR